MRTTRGLMRRSLLCALLCSSLTSCISIHAVNKISEDEIRRVLHGVMEQLGITQPRTEYAALQGANILGPQSIQGGAHEGLQHLGPDGNIPNVVAELTSNNIPKLDQAFPDAPNPCPPGKTVVDGCLENFPNTAKFSKELQQSQPLFETEHNYPMLAKWNKELLYEKLNGGAKRQKRSANPYLMGQRLDNVVAKKSVPHFSDEDDSDISSNKK